MGKTKNLTQFNKQKIFDEKCAPLLKQLRNMCALEEIPFYCTACVANSEKGSVYVCDGLLTGASDMQLKDDRMKKHLLVGLGFDVIPKRNDIEIQMDSPDMM